MHERILPVLLALGLCCASTAASPRYLRQVSEVPAYPIAAGHGTAAILFDAASGSPEAALTLLMLGPGAEVPEHVHDKSVEILYILEGEVEMSIDGTPLKAGPSTAIRIPMNVRHRVRVGSKPLKAVQVYTPPGPEQRFVPKAKP